jgi:hypothetical protein
MWIDWLRMRLLSPATCWHQTWSLSPGVSLKAEEVVVPCDVIAEAVVVPCNVVVDAVVVPYNMAPEEVVVPWCIFWRMWYRSPAMWLCRNGWLSLSCKHVDVGCSNVPWHTFWFGFWSYAAM